MPSHILSSTDQKTVSFKPGKQVENSELLSITYLQRGEESPVVLVGPIFSLLNLPMYTASLHKICFKAPSQI